MEDILLELGLINEEFGDVRTQPNSADLALARLARTVCQAALRGTLEVEILHGGHATVRGSGAMPPADEIRQATQSLGLVWAVHTYGRVGSGQEVDPPTDYGSREFSDGGSIHVHRRRGSGRDEDDKVSVYFGDGAGRASARKAMQGAGFTI